MLERLFEDALILAVHKPTGIPSIRLATSHHRSMEDLLLDEFSENPPKILHRLDTGTSGVLLFAKGEDVYNEMRLKFKNHSIQKHYWAFVHAQPGLQLPEVIRTPLAHHPKSKKRMIPLPPGLKRTFRGKPLPAETRILGIHDANFEGYPCQRLEVEITTGVMHQIRVHLANRGMPILGDPLYGKKEPIRLGLHARSIAFSLRGFRYHVEAPLADQTIPNPQ
jgi:23S rRNA pseudouridine1911/1915/1917 synthase